MRTIEERQGQGKITATAFRRIRSSSAARAMLTHCSTCDDVVEALFRRLRWRKGLAVRAVRRVAPCGRSADSLTENGHRVRGEAQSPVPAQAGARWTATT
jgi:hypothetical protein